MILKLSIKNFLIFESIQIDFKGGLSVLSGGDDVEKSMITDALLFCFGKDLSYDSYIKEGANSCSITSEIYAKDNKEIKEILKNNCIDWTDTIIIKRYKNRSNNHEGFFINDQQITQKTFISVTSELLESNPTDIELLDPSFHIKILDNYAKLEPYKVQLKKLYQDWEASISDQLLCIEKEVKGEIEYLESVVEELSFITTRPDEEMILSEQINQLRQTINQQKIIKQSLEILDEINLNKIATIVSKKLQQDPFLSQALSYLEKAIENLDNGKFFLQSKIHNTSLEHQIFEIEERLFDIRLLTKKHQIEANNLHNFFQESLDKLTQLKHNDKKKQELEEKNKNLFEKCKILALNLSIKRKEHANILEKKLNEVLLYLINKEIFAFKIIIEDNLTEDLSKDGVDRIIFKIKNNSNNTYIDLKEFQVKEKLTDIITSIRILMLENISKPVMLYNQIGISKNHSSLIGEKIKALSEKLQVICITDEAKIAKKADQHFLFCKISQEDQLRYNIKELNLEEQKTEIIKMESSLSGL